jgi:uncharacterized membrane protein
MSDQNPPPTHVTEVVHRNIRALLAVRAAHEKRKRLHQRLADAVTRFAGSMSFIYVQLVFAGLWFGINLGWVPGVPVFDPFPFVMLAMITSVAAIFLSTFILMSQNRMDELANQRADLDLQISLLAEHEITRLIRMLDAVAAHVGAPVPRESGLDELKRDVDPTAVVDQIEQAQRAAPDRPA